MACCSPEIMAYTHRVTGEMYHLGKDFWFVNGKKVFCDELTEETIKNECDPVLLDPEWREVDQFNASLRYWGNRWVLDRWVRIYKDNQGKRYPILPSEEDRLHARGINLATMDVVTGTFAVRREGVLWYTLTLVS